MTFVKPFTEITKKDVDEAGGKGASLGEMTHAGIPVPPGFVVLSSAFERFLDETRVRTDIEAMLEEVDHQEMHTVEHASEKIQQLIISRPMPDDIETDILASHSALGAEFVAVRSSATAEDSASAAWAGQLDTFLNTPRNDVLRRVRECWASLFTPRAIFYRFEKGLHRSHISVAVVVQEMVQSEIAGIGFSVHPVTQDHAQLIIEAGLGLGEAVVSGQITPDSYIVHKKSWETLEKYISEQDRGLYREASGNAWRELGEEGGKQKLADAQINEIAKLLCKIEQHYGFPVDVEWAIAQGKLYITQSRPITTLTK